MSFVVLVVGPRKAGKDTVVGGARVQLRGDTAFRFLRSADQLFSIPLDRDVAAGRILVATVPPTAIPRARAHYPAVAVVSISASEEVLAWRRASDGGADRDESCAVLPIAEFSGAQDEYRIDNSHRPEIAIRQFVRILKRLAARMELTDGGVLMRLQPSSAA